MRWTIRKGERALSEKGRLEYEELSDPASVDKLMHSIHTIERRSWKEQSGTSITAQGKQQAFFEAFAALAAESGMLCGHVLRVDGKPIAYIFGVLDGDSVFLDLKESFDAAYAEYSPGHVLKRFAFQTLIARGVRIYDFMGRCEPYKMRWTDKTYHRLTVVLFNTTFRGSLAHLRSRFGSGSAPLPQASSTQFPYAAIATAQPQMHR
jgi:CelD/BcsL family acetyltransferase involved in cellulose biosynthesis